MLVRKKILKILESADGASSVIEDIREENTTVDVKKNSLNPNAKTIEEGTKRVKKHFLYNFFFKIDKSAAASLNLSSLEYQILKSAPVQSFGYFRQAKSNTPAGALSCVYGSKRDSARLLIYQF